MPQVLLNVRVQKKLPIEEISALQEPMLRVEEELGESGRVLIRYSGTEPLLRIMLEGPDDEHICSRAEELAAVVRQEIGE